MTRASRDPYAGPELLTAGGQDWTTLRKSAQAAARAIPKPRPPTPEQAAVMMGFQSVDDLRAALPYEAQRQELDRVLADHRTVRQLVGQRDALGQPLPRDQYVRLVSAACQRKLDAATSRTRQQAAWDKQHTCQVLGRVDPSTRRRDVRDLLPPGPWGKDTTLLVCDAGWSALARALAERATPADTQAAHTWLDAKLGPAGQPTSSKPKRGPLQRTS